MIDNIQGRSVIHWNPRRNELPAYVSRLPIGRRVSNFGDLLGPAIVRRIVEAAPASVRRRRDSRRLLSIGSILSEARDGDVVWGSGRNGKLSNSDHHFSRLDVRAIRGPRTARFLQERGIPSPDVFGDPALLLPSLFNELNLESVPKTRSLGIVPNFHDLKSYEGLPGVISPRGEPFDVVREILRSEQVLASSLHGLIVAEAFGIPAVPLVSTVEHPFKYLDYFEGTGRSNAVLAASVAEGQRLLADVPWARLEDSWDPQPLLDAFPHDLWPN